MKCVLCEKAISNYNKTFNHLIIGESREVDICEECIHKFISWQGRQLSLLFPTKALKKRYSENK